MEDSVSNILDSVMNDKRIKAIIFDMDGVLVDSEPHHTTLEQRLFNEAGLNVSEAEHLQFKGKTSDLMWRELIEKKGLKISLDELNEIYKKAADSYFSELDNLFPTEGVVDVLETIRQKRIPLAVASSSTKNIIDIILQKTGLKKYFDFIVSSENVDAGKPSPDIFLYTAKLLGENCEACLVIEDSENGIKAAKAAGMTCIAYTGTGGVQESKIADKTIRHFNEFGAVVLP
jgi:beta-phosphoglucomutase family hydrolase